MNFKRLIIFICAFVLTSMSYLSMAYERNINLDFNWKFTLSDQSKYKEPKFDDKQWRTLNLPHDWSIEGEYKEDNPAGKKGGFLPTGTGWYRYHLAYKPEWENKRVYLRFDGVYLNSDVWVNGKHAGHRPNGYVSFSYDITDMMKSRGRIVKDNVIAVRVDHQLAPTGRWYTGSGIYRHVWLDVVDETHVPHDGVFVRTDHINLLNNDAKVLVDTEINNIKANENIRLVQQLKDHNGKVVLNNSTSVKNTKQVNQRISQELNLKNARLWSTDTPYLYTLSTQVYSGKKQLDSIETRVGIRSIGYNVNDGFLLNNQPVELEGMSFHHDAGPVGAAVPDDVWRRRLQQLKDMGMNALRPAHTAFAPIFYDLADEMGFMIMNEAFDGWETEKAFFDYGLHFEQWWKTDLESIVKRDRNHPSVVMWSVGNEVVDATAETQKKLVDFVKNLDNTRPVTQGRGYMLGHLDIDGFNGHGEYKGYLEEHFKNHPKTTQVGTEITHTLQTRGIYRTKTWYRDEIHNKHMWKQIKDKVTYTPNLTEEEVFKDENPHYASSYDNAYVRMNAREEIKMAQRLPYLLGTFRWTAFDYIGEAREWPERTRNFGVIDLAGFEKDTYYLYQSQWSKKPMVHMLPHWTHPGKEGVKIPVVVYTNLEEAELFLNGKSLGSKKMTDDLQIVWLVPYQAGELKVVAKTGRVEQTQVIKTSGKPYTVKLSADKLKVQPNQTDVSHITIDIVDEKGVFVPRADNAVVLELSGPAKIIGVENGDIIDHANHVATTRKAFSGKLMVMLQSTDTAGDISLKVSSKGLKTQTISVMSK